MHVIPLYDAMTYDLFDVALPETSDAIKITTFSVCIFKVVRTVRILRCYRFLTDGVILTLTDGC